MGINFSGGSLTFDDPDRAFGNLEGHFVASMVTASTDIALLLDQAGIVTDIAISEPELFGDDPQSWIGKPFIDTVTVESRRKVENLLRDDLLSTRREINHSTGDGDDLPISYGVLPLSRDGAHVLLGRDLRTIAILQQKLVETQLAVESDYTRLRNAEAQYRLLFDQANEGMLVVDGTSRRVLEANAAARRIFDFDDRRLAGTGLSVLFDAPSLQKIEEMIAYARVSGETEKAELTRAADGPKFLASVRLFRQRGATRLSLHLSPSPRQGRSSSGDDLVAKAGRQLPVALVVTDGSLRIVAASPGFLDLAEIATVQQAMRQSLGDLVGRRAFELTLVKNALETEGSVQTFATHLNRAEGGEIDVDLAATALHENGKTFYAFSLQRRRHGSLEPGDATPLRSASNMTELVGRVPLREIVRETVDIIEQLCIQAALDLANNNRASASEMLGLSRQSLYSKLHRYGIDESSRTSKDHEPDRGGTGRPDPLAGTPDAASLPPGVKAD